MPMNFPSGTCPTARWGWRGRRTRSSAAAGRRACLFIDGYDSCITIDCRTYPARSVAEPDKDKVLRGSRDGFVETLIFNTALIRRRIRDPRLTVEILNAGESSRTDIAMLYMEGRVDTHLLNMIKDRINKLRADALTMNQESLAECIYPHKCTIRSPNSAFPSGRTRRRPPSWRETS